MILFILKIKKIKQSIIEDDIKKTREKVKKQKEKKIEDDSEEIKTFKNTPIYLVINDIKINNNNIIKINDNKIKVININITYNEFQYKIIETIILNDNVEFKLGNNIYTSIITDFENIIYLADNLEEYKKEYIKILLKDLRIKQNDLNSKIDNLYNEINNL